MDRSSSFQNFLLSSDSLRTLSNISKCSSIVSACSSDLDSSFSLADSSEITKEMLLGNAETEVGNLRALNVRPGDKKVDEAGAGASIFRSCCAGY